MIQLRPRAPRDPDAPNRFVPGDLVRHRRYGYRGVVVAFDTSCAASDAWYSGNRTQPARDQPWYHVLVGDSPSSTYAAEDSLIAEPEPAEIAHPLVAVFFSAFVGDHYLRNEHAWPYESP